MKSSKCEAFSCKVHTHLLLSVLSISPAYICGWCSYFVLIREWSVAKMLLEFPPRSCFSPLIARDEMCQVSASLGWESRYCHRSFPAFKDDVQLADYKAKRLHGGSELPSKGICFERWSGVSTSSRVQDRCALESFRRTIFQKEFL